MPVISRIGRKALKTRLLIGVIYALLFGGTATMLYPFALMIAGSTKSAVDMRDADIVPKYIVDNAALYRKHIEAQFNENLTLMQIVYANEVTSFDKLEMPGDLNDKLISAWLEFLEKSPPRHYAYEIGHIWSPVSRGALPYRFRELKSQMAERFDGDIETLNLAMETQFPTWRAFHILPADYLIRRTTVGTTPLEDEYRSFKKTIPHEERYYFSVDGFYRSHMRTQYGKSIDQYNEAHGTKYARWQDVHLSQSLPCPCSASELELKEWEDFVRTLLNLFWVRVDASAVPSYRAFLAAKYGDVETLNARHETSYGSFDDAQLIDEPPQTGIVRTDWDSFIQGWKAPDTQQLHMAPVESLRVHGVDFQFRDFMRARFESIDTLNAAMGTEYDGWPAVLPPQQGLHVQSFRARSGELRREFTVRNFITVTDFIVLHGRAIYNTVVYCALAIFSALLVNPVAAYALSRFAPPSTYKILLFLMLTMAFPPMVTQIPAFLLLRNLNLLNTYWALILPGIANGYWIFLLKGFFDSQPRELYECASLDGAGECRIFWQITMSLSKPVLAVIALNAFTGAYSNFLMALLVCQDKDMWTLMPWLYNLQSGSGEGVVYASLLIAAVPTLLVFMFCQNIIMRGIVVPVEK